MQRQITEKHKMNPILPKNSISHADVNKKPPFFGVVTGIKSSTSMHNGNAVEIFLKKKSMKIYHIWNNPLNIELSCLHLVSSVRYGTCYIWKHMSCFCCMWHNPFPLPCSFSDLVLRASIFCRRYGSPKPLIM